MVLHERSGIAMLVEKQWCYVDIKFPPFAIAVAYINEPFAMHKLIAFLIS